MSIVPPLKIGMVDTMCLDYANRWYALVVCDLGSGMAWAYVIRDAHPPTAAACFVTYLVHYAAVYGPHRLVVCDRDSIFSGVEATHMWQQLGVERESIGAYAHFSMGFCERRIGMFRWAVDRIRVEAPPNTLSGWEVTLMSIGNAFYNEADYTGTTPSQRLTGYQSSLLRNALNDTPVTATGGDAFRS